MPKVQILCPNCGAISIVDPSDTKAVCVKCGHSLFVDKLVFGQTLNHIGNKVNKNIKSAKQLLDDEDWPKLKRKALIMIEENPEEFLGYAYLICGEAKFNVFKSTPPVTYMLNSNTIQDDVKARIYHFARKKYSHADSNVLNNLNNYFPDEFNGKHEPSTKYKTSFEEYRHKVYEQKSIFSELKRRYLDRLKSTATSKSQDTFINNFLKWDEYIDMGIRELARYNLEAEKFVEIDYKNTPNPGNLRRFLFSLFVLIFSSLVFLSSLASLTTCLVDVKLFSDNLGVIFASIQGTLTFIVALYICIKNKKFVFKHRLLSIVIMLLVVVLIASNISICAATNNFIAFIVMISIFILLSLGMFCYSLFLTLQYVPHNTYKNGTYIGNYKALCNGKFDVDFPFKWNETNTRKKKDR